MFTVWSGWYKQLQESRNLFLVPLFDKISQRCFTVAVWSAPLSCSCLSPWAQTSMWHSSHVERNQQGHGDLLITQETHTGQKIYALASVFQSTVKLQFKHNSMIKNRSTSASMSVFYYVGALLNSLVNNPSLHCTLWSGTSVYTTTRPHLNNSALTLVQRWRDAAQQMVQVQRFTSRRQKREKPRPDRGALFDESSSIQSITSADDKCHPH